MEKMGVEIDYALSIEVHDDVIVKRMSGRRTCKDCSATFHVESNPPKAEGVCDFCGGGAVGPQGRRRGHREGKA